MEYNKQIAYLEAEDEIQGYYLLKNATVKSQQNGSSYLAAIISDASGEIDGKLWEYTGGGIEKEEGNIVKLRAKVVEYRGALQLRIGKIRAVNDDDVGLYSINDIVPSAPIDSMKEMEYVQDLIGTIEDAEYRNIAETMFERHMKMFGKLPAAKSVHHSFLSGLLMHTGNMLKIADFLATEIYPYTVDRSLLLVGTLLHDFAKEHEYAQSKLGLLADFTKEGLLLGHLVMGAEEVEKVGNELGVSNEKIMLLKHMILSHHGQVEFGAAVKPAIAESELLAQIDMLDSRMEIYTETYEKMEKGEMSDRIFALDRKIYNHL